MKVASTQEDYMTAYVVEQLNKLGYYDVEGKSLYKLTATLTMVRAMNS